MSRIEELIKEKCPNGVVYKTLGELGEFMGGLTGKSKDDFSDGNAVFITYKNVYSNLALDIEPLDRVKIAEGENQRTLEYGDVIFTGSSETPDECGISSVVTRHPSKALYLNSFCFVFRFNDLSIIEPDFAKHLFRSHNLRYQIRKTAAGVTRFNVSKDKMKKIMIPLPPIEVQQELARILDKFAELEEGLQSELEARKKQYEHYMFRILLSIENSKEYNLEDVCQIVDCPHTSPQWRNSGIPVIRNYNLVNGKIDIRNMSYVSEEEYIERTKRVVPDENDILFSREAPIGNVGIVPPNFKCCQGQRVVLLRPKTDIVDPVFLTFLLQGPLVKQQIEIVTHKGGTVSNFNISDLKKLKLIIPPLSEQGGAVSVLKKFDDLCNDYENGLPAEIEARRKQYEYYRDTLLSFERLGE